MLDAVHLHQTGISFSPTDKKYRQTLTRLCVFHHTDFYQHKWRCFLELKNMHKTFRESSLGISPRSSNKRFCLNACKKPKQMFEERE